MGLDSENISGKRRGRPKGFAARNLELSSFAYTVEGVHRTKINWIFMLDAIRLIRTANEDMQRIVWGCTAEEIKSGEARFPKGWKTYAPEIGRFLQGVDDEGRPDVLKVIIDARQRGLSWADIAAHYRSLRIGEKSGNEDALTKALLRAVTQFRKQFPKTPDDVYVNAANRLVKALNGDTGHHERPWLEDDELNEPAD